MTKDLVALSSRARSIAIIAVLVACATLLTGPAPARALVRSLTGKRRRRRDMHSTATPEPVVVPVAEAVPAPTAEAPEEIAVQDTRKPAPTQASAQDSPGRSATGLQAGAPVIGYVTAPAHAVHADLSPTERTIEQACERAGWRLVAIVRDPEGGRILDRPGLSQALEQITNGQAAGLVVNDARLLSRSLDFAGLVNWFRDAEVPLIALDLGLDTSTPEGSRVASTLITLNGWAGDRIARRAKVSVVPKRPDVLERVAAMHRDDMTPETIADQLNSEGVQTPSGADVWWPSTVQTALRYWRDQARAPMEEVALERRASA